MGSIRRHPAWAAVPLIALFVVAYLYPLVRMLEDAVLTTDLGTNVARMIDVPLYSNVLQRTMWIALIVSFSTVLIAYPLAAFIASRPSRQRALLLAVLFVPLLTSVVVRTYVWVAILRPRGVLDGLSVALGLPVLDGALYQSELAVLIGMVHLMTPFATLPLYAGFLRIDPELRPAAASLGAGWLSQWRRLVLPLTMPSVLAASVLVFVTTLGFVITPAILGGPRGVMLGVLISRQMAVNDIPFAALLSTALLGATVLALVALRLAAGRFRRMGLL